MVSGAPLTLLGSTFRPHLLQPGNRCCESKMNHLEKFWTGENPDVLEGSGWHIPQNTTDWLIKEQTFLYHIRVLKVEKISFPIIFPSITPRSWLWQLRTYCRCPQGSSVPPSQIRHGLFFFLKPTTSIRELVEISDHFLLNSSYSDGINVLGNSSNTLITTRNISGKSCATQSHSSF